MRPGGDVRRRPRAVLHTAGHGGDLTEGTTPDDEDAAADEPVEDGAGEPVEEARVDDSAAPAAEAPVEDDEKDATKA